MKTKILCAVMAIGLLVGCTETRKHMGASSENDQNVLTGGPVSGTKISDLPDAVRNTLKERVPSAEVADIDKKTEDGKVCYKISFIEPGKNPAMFISEDGTVKQDSNFKEKSKE